MLYPQSIQQLTSTIVGTMSVLLMLSMTHCCRGQPVATADTNSDQAAASLFSREADLIYRKQGGFALTMEKVAPQADKNNAAIVIVMSGGWLSSHDMTKPHAADQ